MSYESRIPLIVAEIQKGVADAVERAGYRMEKEAKARARYATGYMRGQIRFYPGKSVGAINWTTDNKGRTSLARSSLVSSGRFTGVVIGGASYTIFNELGTVYMSAQPMFTPAAEVVSSLFEAEVRAVLRKAAE